MTPEALIWHLESYRQNGERVPPHQNPLAERELPGIFASADEISKQSQKEYLRWTRGRLQLAVLAATAGITAASSKDDSWLETTSTCIALISFVTALIFEVHLLRDRPEERWYHGRAIAESAKTLAWRYMAIAEPFPASLTPDRAEDVLLARIQDLFAESSPNLPGLSVGSSQVTSKMRQIRSSNLPARKATYLTLRVSDQQAWYEKKAKENESNAKRWRLTLVSFEILGITTTVITLLDITNLDVGATLAAAIAAGGAWLEVKQYDNLSSAYALTAAELSFVRATGESIPNEEKWSDYVVSAEQAISREHTMWLARRVGLRAARRNG
ncbi:DUF4231 domain-containing protein [Streptomyces sp. WAC 00631]|uniref:DUF4231 domain-containing protein n=1 Tax=Streptomyces sp. WAC 00631 TaxID=2203201 RepID=UPI000F77CFF9|nr:DUF4231 domain-containing protein [Streptomyces sp. WAC 00631]MCC5032905.1 DUF4231 domain-containing protein [Streptomyces sp. WAC 00631]